MIRTRLRRLLIVLGPLAGLAMAAVPNPAAAAGAAPHVHHPDRIHSAGATPAAAGGNLAYNGGAILTAPKVYLVFWGPEWAAGFTTGGFSSSQAQAYLSGLFSRVGGSDWAQTDTQYCQSTAAVPVATGSQGCPAGASHAGNPSGILAGTWVDAGHAVPASPMDADIAAESKQAVLHFGYDRQAMYFVVSPSGKSQSGFGSSWCAWHGDDYEAGIGQWAYTYLPYQPDAGSHCGVNSVNRTSDAFGHGYFDGFSIVGGHEFAETVTDPYPNGGWLDAGGAENGDKCQWTGIGNVSFGDQFFAMQPTWSNAVGGCAMTTSTSTPPPPAGRNGGALHPLTPARILDTRTGLGGLGRLSGGQRVELAVLGAGGVPASGVQAVVLNLTATDAGTGGWIAAYAGGTSWPGNSNLNYLPGQAAANLVEAPVGTNGRVGFVNGSSGGVALVADVVGWIDDGSPAAAGGRLNSLPPQRILDTRSTGSRLQPGTGGAINLRVVGVGGVPAGGVSAVVLNVTVTNPAGGGFLSVYPTGAGWPGNSNVNFGDGQTIPNRVIAQVGAGGQVAILASTQTDVVVDVGGWFSDGSVASPSGTYMPTVPARILDTRTGGRPVGAGGTVVLSVAGAGGVPGSGVRAVALNVTAADVTAPSFVAVYPHGSSYQVTSDLNTVAGLVSTNMVIVQLGSDGAVVLLNAAGSTDLIVDVVGWYS